MLIAMAGLPGTGKSTLADRLAEALGGVVLGKDVVRSALFPSPVLDYSREQDDLTMRAIYSAVGYIHRAFPGRPVILDGRTFSRAYQIRDLLAAAEPLGEPVRMIECTCADEIARSRLGRDYAAGTHLAGNRSPDLYEVAKGRAEAITVPRLVLDTGATPLDECVSQAIGYLAQFRANA